MMKRDLRKLAIATTAAAGLMVGGAQAADHRAGMDIVDTAVAAGQFETLAAVLQAADLVSTLKGDGPFTVFAPTDEAFAALPEGTVETLLQPENRDQLVSILTYHVVPGRVTAADVFELDEATTVNGSKVAIPTLLPFTTKTPPGRKICRAALATASDTQIRVPRYLLAPSSRAAVFTVSPMAV